jgi:chromosome transmission fidelity protein 4
MLPVRAAALCTDAAPGVVDGGDAAPAPASAAAAPSTAAAATPQMLLAMGGDDPTVKLVALPQPAGADAGGGGDDATRCARARSFRSVVVAGGGGYVRALALDPEGRYAAARLHDGSVAVWDAAEGGRQVARKRVGGPEEEGEAAQGNGNGKAKGGANPSSSAACCLDWHPDGGTLLAAPGDDADVALIERLSWRTVAYLAHPRAHGAAVTALSFSPNGGYCASASARDGRVAVWRVSAAGEAAAGGSVGGAGDGGALVRAARVVAGGAGAGGAGVTRLAWHPAADCLAIAGAGGGVAVWRGVVSAGGKRAGAAAAAAAALASPWRPVDELLREADKSRGGGERGDGGRRRRHRLGSEEEEDEEDDDEVGAEQGGEDGSSMLLGSESGGGGGRVKRARRGGASSEEEEEEEEDGGRRGRDDRRRRRPASAAAAAAPLQQQLQRVQAPVQPGATKPSAADAALYATTAKAQHAALDPSRLPRFLAYNSAGCVVARPLGEAGAGVGGDGSGAQALEVAFHDAGAAGRARAPVLTDYYGVTMAALGARGVAYASPPSSRGGGGGGAASQPAMLLFRPLGAWAAGSEWSAALPEPGEAPRCLAVGRSWVAVATSRRVLRVYSLAGRQLAVASLPGDAVALAAAAAAGGGDEGDDDGGNGANNEDEGERDRLAVAWADGPPESGTGTEYDGTQRLSVWVTRVREGGLVGVGGGLGGGGGGGGNGLAGAAAAGAPCRLPLSPGASLRWLGFSEPEGLLAAYDTAGVMRVKPCAGMGAVEAWTPLVFDAAEAGGGGGLGDKGDEEGGGVEGGEGLRSLSSSAARLFGISPATVWPVSVSSSRMLCVVCRDARAHGPPVVPKPVLTALPLRVPGAPAADVAAAAAAAQHEDEWLRARLACRARGTAAAAAVGTDRGVVADTAGGAGAARDDARSAAARAASDKSALRLFHAALKAGRLARALELVGALALDRSVEGALRLAAHQRGAAALADRVAAYLEARRAQLREREEELMMEEVEEERDGWVRGAAAAADDGDDGGASDQHQQVTGGGGGEGGLLAARDAANAAAPSSAAVAAFAARFAGGGGGGGGGKGAAAKGSGAAAAAPRPSRGASGAGGGGGSANPFARVR